MIQTSWVVSSTHKLRLKKCDSQKQFCNYYGRIYYSECSKTSEIFELIARYKWDFPFTCYHNTVSILSSRKLNWCVQILVQTHNMPPFEYMDVIWKMRLVQLDGISANSIYEIFEIEFQFNFDWLKVLWIKASDEPFFPKCRWIQL